jgi:hypothetical protein
VTSISELEAASAEHVLELLADLCQRAQEPADLPHVMGGLADATRRLMDVDRVTVLFLQDDRLKPVVSVARYADSRLWATFLAMPPVVIAPTAEDWQLLRREAPLVVDASSSSLIPPSWRDTFNLRWLTLAPVFSRGRPCGVLVADQAGDDVAPFSPQALKILQAVAALAAGLYNWTTEDDWVSRSAIAAASMSRELTTASDHAAVAGAVARYLRSACAARWCRVVIKDQDTVVASIVTGDNDDAPPNATDPGGPPRRRFHLASDRATGVSTLFNRLNDSSASLIATLTGADTPGGLLPALDAATLQALATLKLLTTKSELTRTQLIDSAHRTAHDIPEDCSLEELVERLAPSLRTAYGLEPVELVLLPPYRRSLGGRAPSREDVRHLKVGAASDSMGRRLIPLPVGAAVVGGLAVRVVNQRKAADTSLFAQWLAMTLHVRHLTQQVTSVDATANDEAQRLERVAAGIGHVLHLLREPSMTSVAVSGPAGADLLRPVVPRVIEELRDLEEMCKMRATSGGGLLQTIRELAAAAEPMHVAVKTQGRISLVPAPLAGCLPVAVRELIELAAGSRARFVVVTVSANETECELSFRADGHLAAADQAATRSTYETIRGLQRMLQPVNATMRLHNGSSHFQVVIKHPADQPGQADLPRPRTLRPRDSS